MRTLRRAVGLSPTAREEPSAALFRAIRLRLVLWYSGILALVLVLCGIVLYFGVRQTLLGPIQSGLQDSAQILSQGWQTEPPNPFHPCDPDRFNPAYRDTLFVCYDVHGNLLGGSLIAQDVGPSFINPTLVKTSLQNGAAQDVVQTGTDLLGQVQRYAVKVPAPGGQGTLGVVQVGAPIGSQLTTLDTLLHLLILLGILTVLFAAVGGLFLANRALLPARLAHLRQRNFIADASHELRTPLTIVRADAEVLLRDRGRLSPDDVAILEDVVSETSHMTSLANNMLNLARLDGGGMQLEQEVVDLTSVAHDLVRRMGPLAAEQSITLRMLDGDPVLVVGDAVLLEQIVVALIDNAIKYNRPGGEVTLRAWLTGQQACLEVRDTGIGIAPEHLARLGERFYRVDKARSREAGGAGLGISIVRSIAARHGGSLHYASDPGHGTTATLILPAARNASTLSIP